MDKAFVSIRDLRLNFAAVKGKIDEFGSVIITDRGEPSFTLKRAPQSPKKRKPLPDYYARLVKRQPKPLSAEASRALREENRGDR